MTRFIYLIIGFVLLACSAARAHELRPAYLEINEVATHRYALTWKVPAQGDYKMALDVLLPPSCMQDGDRAGGFIDNAFVSRWQAVCEGGLAGAVVAIDGLASTYTDALIRVVNFDGTTQTSRVSPDYPDVVIAPTPTAMATARTYFVLGVQHIMTGVDHLLFVFALLLLIGNPRTLLATITSFTVAHSVTLAFATLGIAAVPQPPVEALIALSIMFVGAEIVRSDRGRRNLSSRYPWMISFTFGLLHGFGFGGALREIGLPQKDVPLALLTFNMGVEVGQLAFVAVALLTMAAIRLLVADIARLRVSLAYLIGTVSAFWFAQRIAGFG
ncbi:HupE/UreJ family protein [Rhizobium binxianense]|uniref:HupE/UreJ family protein n=1 Tax=Rhizobium binxianense TaxID=3024242 RepID=UPI00234F04D1|nr:HupE/UreJ family protein [Rhizobium sp. BC56]MDC7741227.1 HupE/UreJ family protein [Rhizobium sp. BC56]